MKSILPFLFLLIAFPGFSQDPQVSLNLNTSWKFKQGDLPEYSTPGYDDSSWKTIRTDRIWENDGYDPYDGYAWYRLRIVIPSSLKEKSHLKDSILIYLGKINNFDQVYLNGQLIGINGVNAKPGMEKDTSWLKAPTAYWDKPRPYTLSISDPLLLWDKENVIAVRVFDQGGQGGMYTGDQMIRMTRLADYLQINYNLTPFSFEGEYLKKKIELKNSSSAYVMKGKFVISAVSKLTGKEIYSRKYNLQLGKLERSEFEISVRQLSQSALISYLFTFESSGEKLSRKDETPYLTTPPAPEFPRINGPSITAARPGRPFLYSIPATGARPMNFSANDLPEGLALDPATGIITGKVAREGNYRVLLKASNGKGEDAKVITISIGERICLTPPMGWNSWNCWGTAVDEQKVLASARAFREKGLADHGWMYINVDDAWEIYKDKEPKRDPWGNILTNEKFPDMKRLGDSIHAKGLKFGIYSSPGPLTCGGYTASYQYEEQDARSYAAWGVDYLKYDWCSYDNIAKDTSLAERKKPYFVMRDALSRVDRDIVYSLCQYGMSRVWEWGDEVGGNLWRTTGDITDTWESLKEIGFSQVENQVYAKPGNWNDPDMLIVGKVGWGPNLHPTRLTPDEQYTHISLWCLLSAPLLIGCDLSQLDDFTLNLLTNDEVLDIDQDTLGKQAKRIIRDGDIQVWVKELSDGSRAFGIFNTGEKTVNYVLDMQKAGLRPGGELRDVWRQKMLRKAGGNEEFSIPSHGVVLIKYSMPAVRQQG